MLMLAAFLAMAPAVGAELSDELDLKALEDELPGEAAGLLEDASPGTMPGRELWERLVSWAGDTLSALLPDSARSAARLLSVCLITSVGSSMDSTGRVGRYVLLAGVLAIGVWALQDFQEYLHMGTSSLESLADYSHVLLPTLTTAAAAGGAVTSAAGKYAATVLAMDALLTVSQSVLCPLISACALLSVAGAALGTETLHAAMKLCRWVCGVLLSLMAVGFTAWLTLTGVIAGTADAMTTRAAKTLLSSALPVVGSIVSDAAGTLAVAAQTLRNSVGVFGMAAVLVISLGPFLTLLLRFLVFKLTAAVAACLADKRISELIARLGGCFGLILALNGTGALMLFISIYSLLRSLT